MQPPRVIRIIPAETAALVCALILSLVLPCPAQTDVESADEAALRANAVRIFKENVDPFVKTYCTKCHGGGRAKANVNLEVDLKDPGRGTAFMHWKKAVANVKVHDMPPEDAARQPTDEERHQFIEWMGNLKYLSPQDPGSFVIRRLTPVEYGNTLHDLFGVDPSIADNLPEEVIGEGYLNSISPCNRNCSSIWPTRLLNRLWRPKACRQPQFSCGFLAGNHPKVPTPANQRARPPARWHAMFTVDRPPRRSWMSSWTSSTWPARTIWITPPRWA